MSTTLGGGEVLVVEEEVEVESKLEEEVEVESKLGEEEAREEREKIRRTVDGTSLIAKQNCDWSSLGQNYLVAELGCPNVTLRHIGVLQRPDESNHC